MLLVLWGVFAVEANAQLIVEFSSVGSPNLQDSAALALPDGSQVQIGYFDSGFDLAGQASNLSGLAGAWHEFGAATVTTTFLGPGQIGGSVSGSSSGPNSFESQKIYLLAFKTSDNNSPNFNLSNVSEYGLFSSSQAAWQFPANASAPPPGNRTSLFTSEVNQVFFGNLASGSPGALQLASVPEPSSAGGAMALGLLVGASVYQSRRLRARVSRPSPES